MPIHRRCRHIERVENDGPATRARQSRSLGRTMIPSNCSCCTPQQPRQRNRYPERDRIRKLGEPSKPHPALSGREDTKRHRIFARADPAPTTRACRRQSGYRFHHRRTAAASTAGPSMVPDVPLHGFPLSMRLPLCRKIGLRNTRGKKRPRGCEPAGPVEIGIRGLWKGNRTYVWSQLIMSHWLTNFIGGFCTLLEPLLLPRFSFEFCRHF